MQQQPALARRITEPEVAGGARPNRPWTPEEPIQDGGALDALMAGFPFDWMAAASAGPDPEPEAPLRIASGAITRLGEGNDAQTRRAHWPRTEGSGVTVGKGYDLGGRTADEVRADLIGAGLDPIQASILAGAAGIKGDAAGAWVRAHAAAVGDIPVEVQRDLFRAAFASYTDLAHARATSTVADKDQINAAGRERRAGVRAGTFVLSEDEWSRLHPAMVELLTDLTYQGGYYGYGRVAQINVQLKRHDGDPLAQLKVVRDLFANGTMDRYAAQIGEKPGRSGARERILGEDIDLAGRYRRNTIRLTFLDQVIGSLSTGRSVVISEVE